MTTDMAVTSAGNRPNPAGKPTGAKGSEALRWAKVIEDDLALYAKYLDEKSQTIYKGVIKSPDAGAINKRAAARVLRVRLRVVAGCCRLASKHMGAFRHDWIRMLGNPSTTTPNERTGFDLRA